MEVVEAPQNSEARGMNGPWAAHSPHGKMEEHGMNGLGAAYSPRCKMKRHCLSKFLLSARRRSHCHDVIIDV